MTRRLAFTKMHGAGNDFVMLDAADLTAAGVVLDRAFVAALCGRRTAIGADGLIVVGPDDDGADFAMTYYNRDGGEAEMCGNGARCAFAFAHARGRVPEAGSFRTASGIVDGRLADGEIDVALPPVRDVALDVVPQTEHPFARVHAANTGVPHLVVPVPNVEAVDLPRWGRALRYDPAFAPQGANVNFVQPRADGDAFLLRTYERGVEGETLACGTGASATALVLCRLGEAASPVALLTRGGDRLTITVEDAQGVAPGLRLRGPAVTAFRGEVEIA